MVFNLVYVQTNNWQWHKMQANRLQLWSPVDAAVLCGGYCPMEHIQGFTRSHWMLPLGKCLHHIAPAAVMVDEFVENTQNTKKKHYQLATYGTINH
jgi:hypothetical protein